MIMHLTNIDHAIRQQNIKTFFENAKMAGVNIVKDIDHNLLFEQCNHCGIIDLTEHLFSATFEFGNSETFEENGWNHGRICSLCKDRAKELKNSPFNLHIQDNS